MKQCYYENDCFSSQYSMLVFSNIIKDIQKSFCDNPNLVVSSQIIKASFLHIHIVILTSETSKSLQKNIMFKLKVSTKFPEKPPKLFCLTNVRNKIILVLLSYTV